MFQPIEIISRWTADILSQSGYLGVFLLSVLDRIVFSLIPAEAVFPLIGFLAAKGDFILLVALLLITAGNLAGDIIIYFVSLKGGRRILEKYGKYILVSKHELDHADEVFAKHGAKIVLIGRILPIVRTIVSIPAGMARMAFGKFIFYTIIGSLPWNVGLTFVGFKIGKNWDILRPYFRKLDLVIIGLLAVGAIWYIYHHIQKKHSHE